MRLREVFEAAVTTWGKTGGKVVRKYRCTSGSRKGRLVAKAATCSAPKNVKAGVTLKKTKSRKGSTIKVKTQRTKRSNPASRRVAALNRGTKRARGKK